MDVMFSYRDTPGNELSRAISTVYCRGARVL